MSTIICRLGCPGLSCRGSAGQGGGAGRETGASTAQNSPIRAFGVFIQRVRRDFTAVCYVLGAVMTGKEAREGEGPSVLDVVALLADRSPEHLARGQVGTVWSCSTTGPRSW